MALRKGHGNGKGQPRIEVTPADELPKGQRVELSPGQLTSLKRRLERELSRLDCVDEPPEHLKPFFVMARAWRNAHAQDLATQVGGGVIGPGPLAVLSSATIQLALSRYLAAQCLTTGDVRTAVAATRMMDQHRQNMLAVHELVAREAQARAEARVAPRLTLEQLLEVG